MVNEHSCSLACAGVLPDEKIRACCVPELKCIDCGDRWDKHIPEHRIIRNQITDHQLEGYTFKCIFSAGRFRPPGCGDMWDQRSRQYYEVTRDMYALVFR